MSCNDINEMNNQNKASFAGANAPGKNMLDKIRCSHSKPGPTSVSDSSISRLRKIQARSISHVPVKFDGTGRGSRSKHVGTGQPTMGLRRVQRFGTKTDNTSGTNAFNTHGVCGDASQHIYFRRIFSRVNTTL